MSSEVLGRFLLRVARPRLPHALWLLDLALPLAEEAVEVTAPAIKAPDTAWQPRVCQNKCFFSAAATSTGGKDGDEPYAQPCCRDEAPGLASLPCGVAGCVLGSGGSADPAMVLCALSLPSSCAGTGGTHHSPAGAHGARARERRDGSATGRLPAAGTAGEESSTGERGHGQCKPAPEGDLSVCLSVCHRAWSRALTGCQAVPLHAPRGLLVLEGKVWPFPPVSETRPASPRNKLLLKALASEELCSAKPSVERRGDPVPLQLGTQRRRAA